MNVYLRESIARKKLVKMLKNNDHAIKIFVPKKLTTVITDLEIVKSRI